MQLPRGTFREIRKKVHLGDLLSELGRTGFTGTCSIVAGPATGTFVFSAGACILAKFRGQPGDAGLEESRRYAGEAVDVILSTLDDAQLKLSVEFNPSCRTGKGGSSVPHAAGTTAPQSAGKKPAVHSGHHAASHAHSPPRPSVTATGPPGPATPDEKVEETPAPETTARQRAGHARTNGHHRHLPKEGTEDLESDIDALDSMDLEKVSSRIRSDCRALVRELRMDHLMER